MNEEWTFLIGVENLEGVHEQENKYPYFRNL